MNYNRLLSLGLAGGLLLGSSLSAFAKDKDKDKDKNKDKKKDQNRIEEVHGRLRAVQQNFTREGAKKDGKDRDDDRNLNRESEKDRKRHAKQRYEENKQRGYGYYDRGGVYDRGGYGPGYGYGRAPVVYGGAPVVGLSITREVYSPPLPAYRGVIVDESREEYPVEVEVQLRLRRAGYYQGAIDGDIGPGTRRAIWEFQEDNGLRPTGRIDRSLLQTLDLL